MKETRQGPGENKDFLGNSNSNHVEHIFPAIAVDVPDLDTFLTEEGVLKGVRFLFARILKLRKKGELQDCSQIVYSNFHEYIIQCFSTE